MAERQVFIYVIGTEPGPKKVGIASNPERRLAAIQTGSPIKLRLLAALPCGAADARGMEGAIHHALGLRRLSGEWFDVGLNEAIEVSNSVLSSGPIKRIAPRDNCSTSTSISGPLGSLELRLKKLRMDPDDLVSMLQIDLKTLEWHMRQGHPVPRAIRAFLAAWEMLSDDNRGALREMLK